MENFLVYGGALLALAGVIYGYLKLSSLVKGGKPEKPLLLSYTSLVPFQGQFSTLSE